MPGWARGAMIKLIDSVPKFITTISLFVLIVAVVHDWGYFSVVGSKFQQVQTTYDFVSNSIDWLPLPVLALAALMLLGMRLSRPVEYFDGVLFAKFRWRRRLAFAFFLVLTAILLVANFEWNLPSWVFYPGLLTSLLLLALGLIAQFPSGLDRQTDRAIAIAVLLGGLICCFAHFFGAYSAIEDMYVLTSNIYTIELKSGAPSAVKVLRTFEKGLLQYNTRERAISFIRWDEVKSLRRQQNVDDEGVPPMCLAVGFIRPAMGDIAARDSYEALLAALCVPNSLPIPKKYQTLVNEYRARMNLPARSPSTPEE
jgi:hypothetical protein